MERKIKKRKEILMIPVKKLLTPPLIPVYSKHQSSISLQVLVEIFGVDDDSVGHRRILAGNFWAFLRIKCQ